MIRLFSFFSAMLAASMILSACSETATIPAVCKTDAIGCAVFSSGQTIKIGLGAPMTGENAAIGQDISQAARLAVSDAALIHGFSFELDTEDDGGTPTGAAEVANQFAGDPQIIAVVGHIFSGATRAAIPIYEAAGIPMMSPSATVDTLTENGAKVFNRLDIPDGKQGRFAADRLYHFLKVTNLAVLYDSSTDGQGIAQAVNDSFKALGGNVVIFQAISPGESDHSEVLAGVASRKPDAICSMAVPLRKLLFWSMNWQAQVSRMSFFSLMKAFSIRISSGALVPTTLASMPAPANGPPVQTPKPNSMPPIWPRMAKRPAAFPPIPGRAMILRLF